jgi:hypothetical protein
MMWASSIDTAYPLPAFIHCEGTERVRRAVEDRGVWAWGKGSGPTLGLGD